MNNKKTSFDDANFKVVLKKFLRDWSALEYEDNPRYQNLKFGHFTTPEHYEALLVAEQQIQQIEQAKQNNGKE